MAQDFGSFAYDRVKKGLLNNSVVLDAYVYRQNGSELVPKGDITSVAFTVVKPGGDPDVPDVDGAIGDVIEDGHGRYVVTASLNDTAGQYKAIATFAFVDGELSLIESKICDYDIVDPFVRTAASPADGAVGECWTKLEDCFDSDYGGPWLRDMTLAVFDRTKIRAFVPEALLAINQQMPYSDYSETSFPYGNNDGTALMAEALLVSALRHLMRSYTEQPDVVNSPVAFEDRKRYQEAWRAVYEVELPMFERWLMRWKLRTYDLSGSSLLVGTKAGRMFPAPMRSRNVGRGFGV